jgi:ribose 5-phosphate isomerase B
MIILGADHGGFLLKEKIKEKLCDKGYSVVDVGAFEEDSDDDFSKFVKLMCKAFDKATAEKITSQNSQVIEEKLGKNEKKIDEFEDVKIIAFCGSGVGVSIGLNKHKNIFCAVGHSKDEVEKACLHNGINALALGGRVTAVDDAEKMVEVFLSTKSLGGKYARRMQELCE